MVIREHGHVCCACSRFYATVDPALLIASVSFVLASLRALSFWSSIIRTSFMLMNLPANGERTRRGHAETLSPSLQDAIET